MGVASGLVVQRELLPVQMNGVHAAPETIADLGAPSVPGALLTDVATKEHVVIQVQGFQGPRGRARRGVDLVQDQARVVAVHLQGHRVPQPVVDRGALHGHDAGAAPAVKLVLQPPVMDLRGKQGRLTLPSQNLRSNICRRGAWAAEGRNVGRPRV